MKLTKTEEAILARLNERGHYGAQSSHGTGPEGGKHRSGNRTFDACRRLIEKGLAVQIGDLSHHTFTRQGYSIFCTDISIRHPDEALYRQLRDGKPQLVKGTST